MSASVFSRLCDLTDELARIEHRMPHSEIQCALAALVERFDALLDESLGIEVALELDLDPDIRCEW